MRARRSSQTFKARQKGPGLSCDTAVAYALYYVARWEIASTTRSFGSACRFDVECSRPERRVNGLRCSGRNQASRGRSRQAGLPSELSCLPISTLLPALPVRSRPLTCSIIELELELGRWIFSSIRTVPVIRAGAHLLSSLRRSEEGLLLG